MASHGTPRGLPLFPLLPLLLALFLSSPLPSLATLKSSKGPFTDLLKDIDTENLRDAPDDTPGTPDSNGEISLVTTDSEDILSGVSDATASSQRASTWRAGLGKRLSTKECEAFKARLASSLKRTPTDTGAGSGSDSEGASGGATWPPGEYRRRPSQCWSRAEWLCFATMAPGTKPSKNLGEMLKMYQRRVRECRVLEPPGKLRERLLAGTPTACQYMLWSPTKDGLGNQMLSLASAFAYSLLTFRVLLVEPHNASVSHLFCEPFPRLPSWKFAHVADFGAAKVGSSSEVGGYRINTAFDLDQPPPTVLSFHVHLMSDMQPFLCPEFHRWAQGASALVTSSVVYWLPGLYFIPHFRAKLEALFPSRRAYATLLPIVLLPSNHVWEEATRFLVTKGPFALNPQGPVPPPSYGGLRVGIQFRQNFGVKLEEGVESVVQCYRKISTELKTQEPNLGPLSPQAPKAPYAPSSPNLPEIFNGAARRFVDFFGDSGGLSLYRPKAVTIYLASLNGSFSQGVMEAMDRAGVEAEAVSLTKDKEQVFWDTRHNEKALVDILSVALSSQALIVTPRSTFGYTIVGYSSAPAYFISPCVRAMQEPCFLRPPNNVKCRYSEFEVEKGEIPGVSRPLLRSCPDALWLHQIGQYQLSDGVVVGNEALRI